LRSIYGDRLQAVYLFGSYARGEAQAESDIDVLIVLDHITQYGSEVAATSKLVGRLSLKYGVSISRKFIGFSAWQKPNNALLRNIHAESILV
jgi:predicted nucleotidyltransferase